MSDEKRFECWAILELLGHRRLAGYLTEQQIAGAAFLRIDVPGEDGKTTTQLYSPQAVYAITPCTEDTARKAAALGQPAPVQLWELPRIPAREAATPDVSDVRHWQDEEDDEQPY